MKGVNTALIAGMLLLFVTRLDAAPVTGEGGVGYVIDGDTYWIYAEDPEVFDQVTRDAGRSHVRPASLGFKARILNIDTPESKHVDPSRNTELGAIVSQVVQAELSNQPITFTCEGVGKYGRPLCTVYLNGEDYGLSLIRRGYATYLTRFGNHKWNHEGYLQAEKEGKSVVHKINYTH